MGRPNGDAIRHVAWTRFSAGSKAAHPGKAAAEVGPVTFLTTREAAFLTRLRLGISTMQGGVPPAGRMSSRAVGVAALPVEFRLETTDLGDTAKEVAAVTLIAQVPVAHKSRTVINDPICGMLAGRIDSGPAGMTGLPGEIRTETTDPGYSSRKVAAVTPEAPARISHKRRPVVDDPAGGVPAECVQCGAVAVRAAAARQTCQSYQGKYLREHPSHEHNFPPASYSMSEHADFRAGAVQTGSSGGFTKYRCEFDHGTSRYRCLPLPHCA
jgi:hypothetical protein